MHVETWQQCLPSHLDWEQLATLLERAGLNQRDPLLLRQAFAHSQFCWFAYQGERLVGTARAVTDFTYVSYLADVAVDPDCQGQGLGRLLMNTLMSSLSPYGKVFLYAVPDKLDFYRKWGFHCLKTGMIQAEPEVCSRLFSAGYLLDPV